MPTRPLVRTVAAGIVLVLLVGCADSGDATPARPGRDRAIDLGPVAARFRRTCQSPGAAVGFRSRGGTTSFAPAGALAPGIPLGRDAQFLAGSVTKLFVAVVAYQLVDAGRLSLDDTVDRFLPGWPRGEDITVRMLLGHRSGMGDYGNDFGPDLRELVLADPRRAFSYDEVLDRVRAVPPVAEPGTTYHYTNANTIVLGAILQRLTRRTLGALMQRRIIDPLRLDHTVYGPDDLEGANAIMFHGLFDVAGNGAPTDIGAFPRTAALTIDPAGAGLFSTVPDLLTFTHALFDTDALLSRTSRRRLARSVSTLTARDLLLSPRFDIHGHGGASPGAQVIDAFDARSRGTVVAWCNRLDPGPNELLASVLSTKEAFELAGG